MSSITAADILAVVPVTRKTLWLWQKKYNFFPDPLKKLHPSGKGIVGYYPTWVMERCLLVHKLQKKGYTVPIIKEFLRREEQIKSTKKILIIDDEEITTRFLERYFIKNGFLVEIAHDGLDAGMKVTTFIPSIILLNISLPGINGVEICQLLKKNINTQHISIIAVSGNLDYSEKSILEAGAEMFMKKPLDIAQLFDKCIKLVKEPAKS